MAFEVEALQRALAEALADVAVERHARESAEAKAEAAAAEAAAAVAEAADAKAEAADAKAEAADAKAEAELQAKLRFFGSMRGMAAYASQRGVTSGSDSSDHVRAYLPQTTLVEDFVCTAFTTLQSHEVRRRWRAFALFFSAWQPPQKADGAFERRNVHPVLNAVVTAALPSSSPLRAWFEVLISDSVDADKIEPDVTLTSTLDRAPSALAAVGYGEWKQPARLGHAGDGSSVAAAQQSRNYARRSILRLAEEADVRGDDISQIQMIVFGSCGRDIVFSRVSSGAPVPGDSYRAAVPFPSQQSPPLPLLAGWDFISKGWSLPSEPPEGFVALACMVSTPRDRLVASVGPLQSIGVQWSLEANKLSIPSAAQYNDVQLGARLGAGGTSDVYMLDCNVTLPGGNNVRGQSAVVKLPRVATASMCKAYQAEVDALDRLAHGNAADAAVFPSLLAYGARRVRSTPAGAPGPERAPWPVLLLA